MSFKVLLSQKCESKSSVGKNKKNINVQHNVNTPYTYREEGVKIFEKPLKGGQDFLVKMEGSPYREFSIEEGQALLFSVWIF